MKGSCFLFSLLLISCPLSWGDVGASGANTGTAGIGIPSPYSAGGNAQLHGTPEGMSQALLDPNYEKCGQDCLYGKANENLSLQIDFVYQKIEYLRTSPSESAKKEMLAGFCSTSESIDSCVDRYIQMKMYWIVKVKGGLANNELTIANLRCNRFDAQGHCLTSSSKDPVFTIETDQNQQQGYNKKDKLGRTPFFSKSNTLAEQARMHAKIKNKDELAGIKDNAQWENQVAASLEPCLEDFIKFKTIPRDPDHPDWGRLQVPLKNAEGALEHDMEACRIAHASWSGLKEKGSCPSCRSHKVVGNSTQPPQQGKDGIRAILSPTTTQGQTIKDAIDQNKRKFEVEFSSQVSPDKRSVDRYLYDQVRGGVVTSINQDMTKRQQANKDLSKMQNQQNQNSNQKQNPQAQKPNPSQSQTPNPIPSGGYSGLEDIRPSRVEESQNSKKIIHYLYSKPSNSIQIRDASSPPPPADLQSVKDTGMGETIELNF